MTENVNLEQWWKALSRSLPAGAGLVVVWRAGAPVPGTDDVPVVPATDEERADELAAPDVAEGLNS